MSETRFIVREPLLNAAKQVVGYELSWHGSDADGGMAGDAELQELLTFVASQMESEEAVHLYGDGVLFFETTPAVILSDVVTALPAKGTVYRLAVADLADTDVLQRVQTLRQLGYGISLCNADDLPLGSPLLSVVNYMEGQFGSDELHTRTLARTDLKAAGVRIVARKLAGWDEYDACATAGMYAFIGNLYMTPRPGQQSRELNSAQIIIVQLMEMVRQNADVRQLEDIIKRDAALSYKLFRYINNAGFGLGAEIQSLRHAVTMLGYSPLYRWLSLLLATASTNSHGAVLMQTAIVRGRFAELAGHGILPKNEAENLFVVGMFSLLDRLLGLPMTEILGKIHLSDDLSQALLTRDGMYGPFLLLAEACEAGNGDIGALADSLFISARRVNEAHLAAMAWAQHIKL